VAEANPHPRRYVSADFLPGFRKSVPENLNPLRLRVRVVLEAGPVGFQHVAKGRSTMKTLFAAWLVLALAGLAGCADKRPVLYPNAHLQQVGNETAQRDIDACIHYAQESGADSDRGTEVAKNTAGGAIIGGAVGTATGAVLGNLGRGAAAGAAGGAAGGLTKGLLQSGDPDPVLKNFVERCLREKGYDPIGWR
jgi:predicted small lipoprotein YifL